MDKRIRRNELCVIGQPRCDFVFSSSRTCFIGYGFNGNGLELSLLKKLLESRGIFAEEARALIAPGQNAFCAKICSKIITSQFCVILLNNDQRDGQEIPNANVNIEYGLMLGFNKYVIPFQKESQKLPFNVAGLDTIKYSDSDFEKRATEAISKAIEATTQNEQPVLIPNQVVEAFLLAKGALVAPVNTEGDRNFFELGRQAGFNYLNDFEGLKLIYFGNFASFRSEIILWRLRILRDILIKRFSSVPKRINLGLATDEMRAQLEFVLKGMRIWVLVVSEEDKKLIRENIGDYPFPLEIFSAADVEAAFHDLKR